MGDFIAAGVLVLIVAFCIRSLLKDRRAGKHSCGGNCGACASSCMCHSKFPAAEDIKKNIS